jgi:hypothetical protein
MPEQVHRGSNEQAQNEVDARKPNRHAGTPSKPEPFFMEKLLSSKRLALVRLDRAMVAAEIDRENDYSLWIYFPGLSVKKAKAGFWPFAVCLESWFGSAFDAEGGVWAVEIVRKNPYRSLQRSFMVGKIHCQGDPTLSSRWDCLVKVGLQTATCWTDLFDLQDSVAGVPDDEIMRDDTALHDLLEIKGGFDKLHTRGFLSACQEHTTRLKGAACRRLSRKGVRMPTERKEDQYKEVKTSSHDCFYSILQGKCRKYHSILYKRRDSV